MHLPVHDENSGIVKALVGTGANANLTGFLGLPVLHWAPTKGDADSVAVLFSGMIRTNALDRRGRNARHYAEPEAVPFSAVLAVNKWFDHSTPALKTNAMNGYCYGKKLSRSQQHYLLQSIAEWWGEERLRRRPGQAVVKNRRQPTAQQPDDTVQLQAAFPSQIRQSNCNSLISLRGG